MPEAREDCSSVIRLFSIWCSLQLYQKCQELLAQLGPKPEDFHLCLLSFHCFTIRCGSLPLKRINMFWDIVIFWEYKDLNKIQSHWILLRSYSYLQEWLQNTFLISPELCPRGQSSAPFVGFCIFHLLSEVGVIKTRTWQLPASAHKKKKVINFFLFFCLISFYREHQTVWFCFSWTFSVINCKFVLSSTFFWGAPSKIKHISERKEGITFHCRIGGKPLVWTNSN